MSENITDQQKLESVAKLNKNSSSGPDGFTPRLIQHLFNLVPSMFYTAVRKELREPDYTFTISPNVKIRKIIFISKKTSKKCIRKLRPISLLSTFYKILSNILSIQLKGAILSNNLFPQEACLLTLQVRTGSCQTTTRYN